jgi:cellulose synthase/poly-beta-1,6-N-acetylglucosamine synthase-like glycosyltransferase
MLLISITIIFLALYAGLIFYYYYHWQQVPYFTGKQDSAKTFISVIVAARNEEEALPRLLKALAAQCYPKNLLEIVIVDDFSTDATQKAVQPFLSDAVKMIQPNVDAGKSSKKRAIESGVQIAKGELLLITDADCIPAPQWVAVMEGFYKQTGAVFIAAPVKFTHNHSLLQIFQTIDFMTLQGITAASVGARFHSMCNGANLAYTKEAFIAVNGFEGIDKVASGDDMLLMHKIWKGNKDKVLYLKNKEAIVTTSPMPTWKEFIKQRQRWASKTAYYDDYRILAVLIFIYLFNCLFVFLLIAAFFNSFYWLLVAAYLIFKTVIEAIFVRSVSLFYSEEKLMKYFPLLQPLHILYTISIGIISQLGTYEWKGRQTK